MLTNSMQRLRLIAIPALAIVPGVLALTSAQWSKHETASLREAQIQVERRIRDEAAQAARARDVESLHARMEAWKRRGLLDAADRFRWIEAVGRARKRARLPDNVDYEFAATATTGTSKKAESPSLSSDLMETPLTVRVRLADETQLLSFLGTLDAEPGGVLRARACEVKRLPNASDDASILEARCEFSVLNVRREDQT